MWMEIPDIEKNSYCKLFTWWGIRTPLTRENSEKNSNVGSSTSYFKNLDRRNGPPLKWLLFSEGPFKKKKIRNLRLHNRSWDAKKYRFPNFQPNRTTLIFGLLIHFAASSHIGRRSNDLRSAQILYNLSMVQIGTSPPGSPIPALFSKN